MLLAVPTRVLPMLRSRLFSWPGKLRMGLDLVLPGRGGHDDESIASFLRRRFGQEAVDRLGEPLLAGIHAGDPERLSILATFPRLRELERTRGSLVRCDAARARATARAKRLRRPSTRCAAVSAELVTALVEAARRRPRCERAPRSSRSSAATGFRARLEAASASKPARVVVAAPGPRIAPALDALVPDAARASARDSLRLDGHGAARIQERRTCATRSTATASSCPRARACGPTPCSFVSTKLPFRAPEGHVLLRGFLGGVRDPGALSLSDDEMIEMCD